MTWIGSISRWPSSITFFVIGISAVLGAKRYVAPWYIAILIVILLAIPSMHATIQWLGAKRGVFLLVSLSLFAYAIEYVGLITGFPYGSFSYGSFGPLLFGVLPLALSFAYVPLVLGSAALTKNIRGAPYKIIAMAGTLLLWDLVLDPGAVLLGYWSYAQQGFYYGVPLSNFFGWILSGVVAGSILVLCSKKRRPPSHLQTSLHLQLCFWTGVACASLMILPAVLGFFCCWWSRPDLY